MKKILFVFLFLISCSNKEIILEEVIEEVVEEKVIEEIKYIKVDIKGAVLNPNVYEIKEDSRINDLIVLAGGLKKDADVSILNLSKKLEDEMSVRIYTKKEIEYYKDLSKQKPIIIEVEIIKEIEKECVTIDENNNNCNEEIAEVDVLININTATKEELMTLPGIGETKANDIINYRVNTLFETIEDLKKVSGIGPSTFENLKHLIKV